MGYVLILMSYYSIATAEFYTYAACEVAGKAYLERMSEMGAHSYTNYQCVPKAQARPQHMQ